MNTDPFEAPRTRDIITEVDNLNEEVKTLALNLAIYLAKAKNKEPAGRLTRMEPEFIRLVNGTVKVVQEMAVLLDAARNNEVMAYDVPAKRNPDSKLAAKIRSISEQCNRILAALSEEA
jgi:hypothetical protein